MLRLLADENVPKSLARMLRSRGVDIVRLQGLGARGISDWEVVNLANSLGRTLLTRDRDFTLPRMVTALRNGVIYLGFQPSRGELGVVAERLALLASRVMFRGSVLVVVGHGFLEFYVF